MTTIFTKIINREVPGHFLYEDEVCVAILDKFPAVKGQALVISKKEVDYAFALDQESFAHMATVAKHIARALDKALGAERTCMVIEGFDVPHVHFKLYPLMDIKTPLGVLMPQGKEASDEELALIATQIIGALEEKDEDE
jgi:histidine triad (HIT) family protein